MLTIVLSSLATAAEIMPMALPQPDGDYPGSITLTSPDEANSIAGRTFRVYRIFDAVLGSENTVAYRIYDDSVREALIQTFFEGDEIGDHYDTELINEVLKLKDASSTDKTGKLQELATNLHKKVSQPSTKVEYVEKTASGDTLKIDNLKLGYYLVAEQNAEGSVNRVIAAFALDTTDPDVEIEMKMGRPKVEKFFDYENTDLSDPKSWDDDDKAPNSASIGDIVNYKIVSTVPDTTGYTSYTYTITDTLSAGLTLVTQDEEGQPVHPVVTLVDKDDNFVRTLVGGGQDYTYTSRVGNTTILQFVINGIMDYPKDYKIVITYSAKLNENAVVGGTGNTNTVNLLYSNNPRSESSTTTTPSDTLRTYTFALDITKTAEGASDYLLPGAKFRLYRTSDNKADTEPKEYVTLSAVQNESGKITGWKVTGWDTDTDNAGEVVTDVDGKALIKGLEAGTYFLEETEAPAGYKKLTAPVKIVIKANIDEETSTFTSLTATIGDSTDEINALPANTEKGINANSTIPITVENRGGPSLPETGGMGTKMIYIIGAALALGAAILLVAKKRMSSAKS